MAESSLRFNWDDFDAQIAEALAENDRAMEGIRPPGKIGSVPVRFSAALTEAVADDIPIATEKP